MSLRRSSDCKSAGRTAILGLDGAVCTSGPTRASVRRAAGAKKFRLREASDHSRARARFIAMAPNTADIGLSDHEGLAHDVDGAVQCGRAHTGREAVHANQMVRTIYIIPSQGFL